MTPQIIRTVYELEALDPDTVLMDRSGFTGPAAYLPKWEKFPRDSDDAVVVIAYAALEDRPADPLASIRQIDGVLIPDQTGPPFLIRPWHTKGDKVARAAGTRQAASTGRLRMVGTHPELEEQATRWLPGQDSPDLMDALTQGLERCMQLVGAEAQIATPGMPTAAPAASSGVGPGFWASPIG